MNSKAMYSLSYGLYVLTAQESGRDNGCIVNTVMQQTAQPNRISVTVNKQNLTAEMIERTGVFNASAIGINAPFSLFERFGFHSGRNTDKFEDFYKLARSENGLYYVTGVCNAFLSAKVVSRLDLGSHFFFLADVTDGEVLTDDWSMTYAFYQTSVKPKPQPKTSTGKVWVCKVCGYVYDEAREGVPFDQLPADWVCPTCKHGKQDFELQA